MTLTEELIKYSKDVISGSIIACQKHNWACQRFLNDLEKQATEAFPYVFSEERAKRYLDWMGLFKHTKGPLAGQLKKPEPIEKFIFGNVFGWVHQGTGYRRFRKAYWQVARKNAKSQDLAIAGLYGLAADAEQYAEVYIAAPLALDTPLLTESGWKTMGTVCVGDKVFNEKGEPCDVTYLSPIVKRKTYKVSFDDGEEIIATDNHLWTVDQLSCMGAGNTHKYKEKTLTTEQLKKRIKYGNGYANKIPIASPIEYDAKELELDPYVLGVWLGDGRSNRGSLCIHEEDYDITDEIKRRGYTLSDYRDASTQPHVMRPTVLGIRKYLRSLNLIDNKHIPELYMRASIEQRMDLLRGLMDTDGTCTATGECRFGASNERLANDAYELMIGLGFKAHLTKHLDMNNNDTWIVSIKAYADRPIFNLKRKRDRQVLLTSTQHLNRWIRSIEEIDPTPARCISVDTQKHLFLVGKGLIATHNTKKEQTRYVWGEASIIAKNSVLDGKIITKFYEPIMSKVILHPKSGSFFSRMSKDDQKKGDGAAPHYGLIDEYHLHDTEEYYGVLTSGMTARRQPLLFIITTAGKDLNKPCYRIEYRYVSDILDPDSEVTNDRYFAMVNELDVDNEGNLLDDIKDEKCWPKANPIVCLTPEGIDAIRDTVATALDKPEKMSDVLTKTFNVWVNQGQSAYLNYAKWKVRGVTKNLLMPDLTQGECYIGVDLTSKIDLASVAFIVDLGDLVAINSHSFMPESMLAQKMKTDKMPYDLWRDQGWLTTTPGDVIDDRFISKYIDDEVKRNKYNAKYCGYDMYNATQFANVMTDDYGYEMVIVRQGIPTLHEPTKEFREMIYRGANTPGKKIIHCNSPVLNMAAKNAVTRSDHNKNIMLDKEHSFANIDPMAAVINGMLFIIKKPEKAPSVYETRGMLSLG